MTSGSFYAGQKYCRMPPLEHSAILLTCIKQKSVLKTIFGLFDSGHFRQVLLYKNSTLFERDENLINE